ncbi:hypothetical protein QF035_010384 [Streptomyces umbrinus]|uniref:Uncharacterized protein n=1 Tax=Streptomyces umbrinus TaxID=67370 RepID=A0ABU0TAX0_9ACTN|nr:hypothetical protein [Streptomyces umbrinus]
MVFGHHPLTARNSPFPVMSGQRLNRRQARAILGAHSVAPVFSSIRPVTPTATSAPSSRRPGTSHCRRSVS